MQARTASPYLGRTQTNEAARPMNASSSSDDDDAPGASTWEGEDETSSEATGDSNAAGERARRVEAAATKRLSLSERLRRLDAAAAAAPGRENQAAAARRRDAAGARLEERAGR